MSKEGFGSDDTARFSDDLIAKNASVLSDEEASRGSGTSFQLGSSYFTQGTRGRIKVPFRPGSNNRRKTPRSRYFSG